MLLFCVVVHGLKGNVSPYDVHYLPHHIRRLFFESLNLSNVNTIELLLPLLSIPILYLQFAYRNAKLTTQQCQAIVARYMEDKKSHQVLLPTEMLNNNADCLDAVRPRWAQYEPGVISVASGTAFTEAEEHQLLSRLGEHPEQCGTSGTALLARSRATFVNNWEMWHDLHGSLWSPPSIIFLLIDMHLSKNIKYDVRLMCHKDVSTCLFTTTVTNWNHTLQPSRSSKHLKSLFKELEQATVHLSRQRQILWELKLVLVQIPILLRRYILDYSLYHLRLATILLQQIIAKSELDDLPEYLLVPLLQEAKFIIYIDSSSIEHKLQALHQRLDLDFCIGGTFETRLLAWKKFLWNRRAPKKQPPVPALISVEEVLLWWGDFDDLSHVLYQNPQFDQPWTIRIPSAAQISQSVMVDSFSKLLALINPILMSQVMALGLLDLATVKASLTQIEENICRGFARSIAASILYNRALDPLHQHLDARCSMTWPFLDTIGIATCSTRACPRIIQTILYGQVNLHDYFDYGMLISASEQA